MQQHFTTDTNLQSYAKKKGAGKKNRPGALDLKAHELFQINTDYIPILSRFWLPIVLITSHKMSDGPNKSGSLSFIWR